MHDTYAVAVADTAACEGSFFNELILALQAMNMTSAQRYSSIIQ